MTIKNILLCSDDRNKYLSFWPTVSYHWKSMGYNVHLALITDKDENDSFINKIKKFGDDIYLFKKNKKYNIVIQSKLARLYISKYYKEEICVVMDIDYYYINIEKILDMSKHIIETKKIATLGYNAYEKAKWKNEGGANPYKKDNIWRFPMSSTVGYGEKIYNLFSNDFNETYQDFLNNIFSKITDNDLLKTQSDETLLLHLNNKRKKWVHDNIIFFKRNDYVGMRAKKRIDRADKCKFDIEKLKNNYYIDICPSRPLKIKQIEYLLDYLNIPKNIQTIKL